MPHGAVLHCALTHSGEATTPHWAYSKRHGPGVAGSGCRWEAPEGAFPRKRFLEFLSVERELRDELYHLEEAHHMRYITSTERLGRSEEFGQGLQQGQMQAAQEVVLEAIAARFGSVSDEVLAAVQHSGSRAALRSP